MGSMEEARLSWESRRDSRREARQEQERIKHVVSLPLLLQELDVLARLTRHDPRVWILLEVINEHQLGDNSGWEKIHKGLAKRDEYVAEQVAYLIGCGFDLEWAATLTANDSNVDAQTFAAAVMQVKRAYRAYLKTNGVTPSVSAKQPEDM